MEWCQPLSSLLKFDPEKWIYQSKLDQFTSFWRKNRTILGWHVGQPERPSTERLSQCWVAARSWVRLRADFVGNSAANWTTIRCSNTNTKPCLSFLKLTAPPTTKPNSKNGIMGKDNFSLSQRVLGRVRPILVRFRSFYDYFQPCICSLLCLSYD